MIFKDFIKDSDFQIIKALQEKYPEANLVICAPWYDQELDQILVDQGVPYYYAEKVTDWDKFNGFLKLSVTDIIVAENLMFDAKFLSSAAKSAGKSLRCFCNICQSSWKQTPSIQTFFIRPEDIEVYENYIDTFEFFTDNMDATRLNVLYKIYAIDRFWFGRIDELILNYEGDERNENIIPLFAERRSECEKKCMKGPLKSSCGLCVRIKELSKAMEESGLELIQKEIKIHGEESEHAEELHSDKSTEESDS